MTYQIAAMIAFTNDAGQVVRVQQVNNCPVSVSSIFDGCAEAYQMLSESGDVIQRLEEDGYFVAIGDVPEDRVLFDTVDDFACEYVMRSDIAELIMVNGDTVETL